LGQGKENTRQFLVENPDIASEVEVKIRSALAVAGGGVGSGDDGDSGGRDD